jgi:hypothetical protein
MELQAPDFGPVGLFTTVQKIALENAHEVQVRVFVSAYLHGRGWESASP